MTASSSAVAADETKLSRLSRSGPAQPSQGDSRPADAASHDPVAIMTQSMLSSCESSVGGTGLRY